MCQPPLLMHSMHGPGTTHTQRQTGAASCSGVTTGQQTGRMPDTRCALPGSTHSNTAPLQQATTTTVLQSCGVQTATSPRKLLGVLAAPPQLPAGLLDAVSADQTCCCCPLVHGYPARFPPACIHQPPCLHTRTHAAQPRHTSDTQVTYKQGLEQPPSPSV